MKTLSSTLEAFYAGGKQTVATCWKITRKDGIVLSYTTHQEALVIASITYSPIQSLEQSVSETTSELERDSLSVNGAMIASNIDRADLLSGKFDNAEIELFQVNYADVTMGTNQLRRGNLAEIKLDDLQFTAEIRGLSERLRKVVGRLAFITCDADLGDTRCGVNLDTFTDGRIATTVTSVTNNRQFTCSTLTPAVGWFDNGKATFTSGLNAGLAFNVKSYTAGGVIVLTRTPPYTISLADGVTVEVGCLKRFAEDCTTKFANHGRFRGFHFIPGIDKMNL